MRSKHSIGRAFLSVGIGLSALAIMLAATLVGSVVRLAVLSAEFQHVVASLRAVEEIEVKLLTSTRAHQLYGETGEERWARESKEQEAELVQAVRAAQQLVKSPEERALVERLASQIQVIRKDVLAKPPVFRTIQRSEVMAALEDSEALVLLNEAAGTQAVERTQHWSRIALVVGAFTLLITLLGTAGVFRYARRAIYLPVKRLRAAIQRSSEDQELRIPADQGPVEVRGIANAVNLLLERLASRRAQTLTFLASVAHDLRTPMSSLRAAAQLACRPVEPHKQEERTKMILRQVDRLNRMVEDLLDVGRIEAGRFDLHLEPRDLREVLRETADLFADTSSRHPVHSELPEEPVVVPHDSARMAQVLSNLVSNAIKYSPEGGEVDLRLRVLQKQVAVEVSDQGLGIAPGERDRIFEPFRRSESRQSVDIPGVGLGLSVARRLVRAHGGDIEVEARPERGSIFRILLPTG